MIKKWLFYGTLVAITFLAFLPSQVPEVVTHADKLNHFIAFLVLAWLFDQAHPQTPSIVVKIFLLFCYGLIIEVVQGFIPFRFLSGLDVLANSAGLIFYLLLRPILWKRFFANRSAGH